jgi:soluble lytic murein transglycosylase-like protein
MPRRPTAPAKPGRRRADAPSPGPARRPRRVAARKRQPRERRAVVALLRITGAGLFLAVLLLLFAPLRDIAGHAADAVVEATHAGRYAASRDAARIRYMVRYGISFELASAIERAALEEGIDPDLAFRLVRVESRFQERAVSPAGALGLTQLMPATANELQAGITREEIFDRDTNLRLGFRYLRWLLRQHDGKVEEALHAYNRGPGTVARIRAAGGDPANGYADHVLRGGRARLPYQGNGLVPTLPEPLSTPWSASEERLRSPVSAF